MFSAPCGVVSEASDFARIRTRRRPAQLGRRRAFCCAALSSSRSERLHTERLPAAVGAEEALVVAAVADATGRATLGALEQVVVACTAVEQSPVTVAHLVLHLRVKSLASLTTPRGPVGLLRS